MGGKGSGRKNVLGSPDPEIVRQMQIEKAQADIERLKKELVDPRWQIYQRTIKIGALSDAYQTLGDEENLIKTLKYQIAYIKENINDIKND